jgi:ubiquinone/menaquinone biosynthesis C-methylase UbiE
MLEYTGERFLPSESGQIRYEHLHRYALCLSAVTGKTVLDIASGEGYGSALLARAARSVMGVDVDQAAVTHANAQYAGRANLRFLHGSAAAIPLPDQAVEVVTSFETIEHHAQHEEMLGEIKRVLQPGGLLIISSPNKLTYSDIPNYQNPFHVKELYYDEFAALLGRHFRHSRYFGQKLAVASFIYNLSASESQPPRPLSGGAPALDAPFAPLPNPLYFVALCSDDPARVAQTLDTSYLDGAEDVWNDQMQAHAAEIARLQAHHQARETEWKQAHDTLKQQNAEKEAVIRRLSENLETIIRSRAWNTLQSFWKWRGKLPF